MNGKTVHVTGMGMVSSLGLGVEETFAHLLSGRRAAEFIPEWSEVDGLGSHVAAFAAEFDKRVIPRSDRRSMSKMSEMMCLATNEALAQAKLDPTELSCSKSMLIVGSTTGSNITIEEAQKRFHTTNSFKGLLSTLVFKCMNHSVAINLASYLKFQGAVLAPSAACATGAQAILMGKQMIASGAYDIVLVGGADECAITSCFSFDVAHAASRSFNASPKLASRPFSADRDGIVVSEGASILVLESEASMKKRGAQSLGRVLGGAQSCDGRHLTKPQLDSMVQTIVSAIQDAKISSKEVGYVNAHATSTRVGDQTEADAVFSALGKGTPISSLKGHMGHSFAAAGSSEGILSLKMLEQGRLIGTANLDSVDPEMPELDFFKESRKFSAGTILSNSFAFGGINVSLLFAS